MNMSIRFETDRFKSRKTNIQQIYLKFSEIE